MSSYRLYSSNSISLGSEPGPSLLALRFSMPRVC